MIFLAIVSRQPSYSTVLFDIDPKSFGEITAIVLLEDELKDLSEHMLVGVAAVYGNGSKEYSQAGRTRKPNSTHTRQELSEIKTDPSAVSM